MLALPGLFSFGGHLRKWARLMNRPVLLVDLLGNGHSDAPKDPAQYALFAQAERLVALLDHLSFPQVDCVGFSLGGMLAQTLLVRNPERLGQVVLVATQAATNERLRTIIENVFAQHRCGVSARSMWRMFHVLCFSAEFLAPANVWPMLDLLGQGLSPSEASVVGQFQQLMSFNMVEPISASPPAVQNKVRAVLAGSADFLMPDQQKLAALWHQTAPVLFPSAGHSVWIECPALVAQAVQNAIPIDTSSR